MIILFFMRMITFLYCASVEELLLFFENAHKYNKRTRKGGRRNPENVFVTEIGKKQPTEFLLVSSILFRWKLEKI